MTLLRLRSQGRSLCRQGVSAALRRVPMSVFAPLRESFPATRASSLLHSLERRLLEVARHRGIPPDVDVFSLLDNPAVSLVRADSFIAERLYWFGEKFGYEPEGVWWWRHFCQRSHSILELGANIGYYTVQGALVAPDSRYIAVEPHEGCAATCRRNLLINGINSVSVIEAAAVSRADVAEVKLVLPGGRDHYAEAPCSGFVGRTEVHQGGGDGRPYDSVTVPAVALGTVMAGVDLLKLDVEGQEFDLLSSVAEELRSLRPTVFLEVLDHTPKLRSLVAELCRGSGYRCYVPTLDRLVPLPVDDMLSKTVRSRLGIRDIVLSCDHVDGAEEPDGA